MMTSGAAAFDTVLTVTQALQLVGLAPCLFVVVFLAGLSFRNAEAIVPTGYFAALACGFAVPLAALYPDAPGWAMATLLFGQSLLSAFVFLLVMQFMLGGVPGWPYWLVLLVPAVGGGLLVNTALFADSDCAHAHACLAAGQVEMLYNIISSGFVFLLLVFCSSRAGDMAADDAHRGHKYWLIVTLILLNVLGLAVDLAQAAGHLSHDEALFTATMLRLAFIYLAITSLFRVFYPGMVREVIQLSEPATPSYNPLADAAHVEKILALLEKEGVFREMRLNRAALAEKVGINEQHLSRVINGHFGKNFNELINGYRIEEAKRRLRAEPGAQITVIGFEAGFNSIASFNRVFKATVGQSPTEYRNGAASAA